MFSLDKFEEWFVASWCVVMPVTGYVLLPSVQGTIPAYMFALSSIGLVFLRMRGGTIDTRTGAYFKVLLQVFLLWLLLLLGSQITLMVTGRQNFGDVPMIDAQIDPIVFRPSLFTQSLYLLACVLTVLYFRFFFQDRWMRYVYWGGYLLAGYGIYEWTYYLVFHQTGDFLANRMFGDHPGSWSQTLDFGGLRLLRIKSTLGEPSFFAAVVLFYLYVAIDARKRLLASLLFFTAIFSTSTACYVGLGFTLVVKSLWTGRPRMGQLAILVIVVAFLALVAAIDPDLFRGMFEDKISGQNESGADRVEVAHATNRLLESFSVGNWIFGIGFGYAYLDIFRELLVNTGLIGLGVFVWIFGRPLWLLPVAPGYEGLKAGLLAIMVLCAVSLSELFLPPTWMFLGLAYHRLEQYQKREGLRSTAFRDAQKRPMASVSTPTQMKS